MLPGLALFNVADPPDSESLKSSASSSPDAFAVAKTGTLNTTVTVLLSEFSLLSTIIGALRSNRRTVFLTWVEAAAEPEAS